MKFSELVDQASEFLQRRKRVTYRALKREFALDDESLEDLKAELIHAKQLAKDEDGTVLIWTGASPVQSSLFEVPSSPLSSPEVLNVGLRTPDTGRSVAERRQLTVMFCDLVGSTALSARLDPEDYRLVVQQYQQTCFEVIQQHEGYLAQYLGDGLLVYFGYPTAHEDDARRAVRTGLEIIAALQEKIPSPLMTEHVLRASERGQGEGARNKAIRVRIGVHTGLVVVGEIGSSEKRELLALGETPNITARIQGLAEPNTVLISAATQRLVERQFESQPFGSHLVKGIDTPIAVYHVRSERQNTSSLAGRISLTPLIGREQEVGLLADRWEQVKEGRGQVVLLSGEPGIGKSRLAYTLREHITSEGSLLFEARCSPYYQHSALYPLIDVLQRTLLFIRQDTDNDKIAKLERTLALYDMQKSLPLFTALLSLPTPSQHSSLNLTPQKQKERTLQALVQLLVAQAERQATVSVWEDLHWADPSSLEFLSLLVEQIPTSKLLLVLTFRPEFTSPWKPRSHISHLVLNRLGKKQVEAMIEKVSGQEAMPADVLQQIVIKTDGVPLFVEELTKSVVESVEARHALPLQSLAIPTTLQEALMARLDRLSTARQVAQLGATLGREFSYELLHAVASLSETDLQAALAKLVEAEILYQRGSGEQTRYFFKHALIQDTAYQSLLKSTRQQYHQQIAQILEKRFPDTKTNQPELLAHHYTEAGLVEHAIPYWHQAGQKASQRSAHIEAVSHLTKGLELLKTLPDIPERAQQELLLQTALCPALMTIKGWAAPEVGMAYVRARELCQRVGEAPQIFPVLYGLCGFYSVRAELLTARELGEQLFTLAKNLQDPPLLVEAHFALGQTLFWLGEFAPAREHVEHGITFYDPQQYRSHASLYGQDSGLSCLVYAALALWLLGYPDQARRRIHNASTLPQELAYFYSQVGVSVIAAMVYQLCREGQKAQERAETAILLSREHGFPFLLPRGTIVRGWALAEQGHEEEGIAQMQQGLTACRAMGAELFLPHGFALLAEVYGSMSQAEEGLSVVSEALTLVNRTGGRFYEAELYRLKGKLTLQQESIERRAESEEQKSKNQNPNSHILDPHGEAEACFHKAIAIAQKQQAKSLELRAVTTLARLWQNQGKRADAHKLLSDVYNWFTEGFDTKDLQEAKALLEELVEG